MNTNSIEEAAENYFSQFRQKFGGINAGEYLDKEDFLKFVKEWQQSKQPTVEPRLTQNFGNEVLEEIIGKSWEKINSALDGVNPHAYRLGYRDCFLSFQKKFENKIIPEENKRTKGIPESDEKYVIIKKDLE